MAGYEGEGDYVVLIDALLAAGFTDDETTSVLGANLVRVLTAVHAAAN